MTFRGRTKALAATLLLTLLPLACSECGVPQVNPGDGGIGDDDDIIWVTPPVDGGTPGVRADGGPLPGADGGVIEPTGNVGVDSVSPPSGIVTGGERVRLDGFGFSPDSRIFFGEAEGIGPLYINDRTMTVFTPPGPAPGPIAITVQSALGTAIEEGLFTYFSPVAISAVDPASGRTAGGDFVTLTGTDLRDGIRVLFGEREVVDLALNVEGTEATLLTPPGEAGRVDIEVVDTFGHSVLPLGFTYRSELALNDVVPRVLDPSISLEIDLLGAGYDETIVSNVAATPAGVVNLISEARLRVAIDLATPAGLASVDATRGAVTQTLSDAVFILGPATGTLTLEGIVPATGDRAGGYEVRLAGEGFSASTGVLVDGALLEEADWVVKTDREIIVTNWPVGSDGAVVDVVVQSDSDNAALAGAFTYLIALGLTEVVPASGPATGGTAIAVTGQGFDIDTVIELGGIPLVDPVLQDEETITGTSPSGTGGDVDVRALQGQDRALLADGFHYEAELFVQSAMPSRGGMSGGTYVTLTGAGFSEGGTTVVQFGSQQAGNVEILSDSIMAVRSPPNLPGIVDVVVTVGSQSVTVNQAYTYFDPTALVGGTRGGPIDGAVYLTALNSFTGFPIEGLGVWLGTEGETEDVAVTNIIGQATISGPNVYGPQTVTVAGIGFEYATLIDVNAAEITLYLQPTVFEMPPPQPGSGFCGDSVVAYPEQCDDGYQCDDGTQCFEFPCMSNEDCLDDYTCVFDDVLQSTRCQKEDARDCAGIGEAFCLSRSWDGCTGNAPDCSIACGDDDRCNQLCQCRPGCEAELTIRGRVHGFAKSFFDPAALSPDEIAVAIVVTTSRDEFQGTPDPCQFNVVFQEGGEYFIAKSRTGPLALIALAGIFNLDTGQFRMRQMGVRRPVFPSAGTHLLDQDVELTIDLDEEIELSMPDAPVGAVDGPTVTRVIPFLRFGSDGSLAYTEAVDTSRNHELTTMPDVPGEMLTFFAGAYTTNKSGLVTEAGTLDLVEGEPFAFGTDTDWGRVDFFGRPLVAGAILVVEGDNGPRWATVVDTAIDNTTILMADDAPFSLAGARYHIGKPSFPQSEVFQDGTGDLINGGVTINPVLGLPQPVSPQVNGVLDDRTLRWKAAPGQQPTAHMMYVYEPFALEVLWTFYIDGSRTKVPIPRIPVALDALLTQPPRDMPPGPFSWQHTAMYVPGFNYNNFSYLELGTRARRAWTTDATIFMYGGD